MTIAGQAYTAQLYFSYNNIVLLKPLSSAAWDDLIPASHTPLPLYLLITLQMSLFLLPAYHPKYQGGCASLNISHCQVTKTQLKQTLAKGGIYWLVEMKRPGISQPSDMARSKWSKVVTNNPSLTTFQFCFPLCWLYSQVQVTLKSWWPSSTPSLYSCSWVTLVESRSFILNCFGKNSEAKSH